MAATGSFAPGGNLGKFGHCALTSPRPSSGPKSVDGRPLRWCTGERCGGDEPVSRCRPVASV